MIEDKFTICTSFNHRLFKDPHQIAYKSLPKIFKNSKFYVYHENSFDSKVDNISIDFSDKSDNVILYDLYEKFPWLENYLKTSHFSKLSNHSNYWIRNSEYWFRKVVSLVDFIMTANETEYGIWFDCDSTVIKPFDQRFLNQLSNNDWCCIFREEWGVTIETGFQVFKLNDDRVKNFCLKYLEYYTSGDVFKNEKQYADNFVLESCFKKFDHDLKLGRLLTNNFDIYEYIKHFKRPLGLVRERKRLIEKKNEFYLKNNKLFNKSIINI
jgi:hypothetical protein